MSPLSVYVSLFSSPLSHTFTFTSRGAAVAKSAVSFHTEQCPLLVVFSYSLSTCLKVQERFAIFPSLAKVSHLYISRISQTSTRQAALGSVFLLSLSLSIHQSVKNASAFSFQVTLLLSLLHTHPTSVFHSPSNSFANAHFQRPLSRPSAPLPRQGYHYLHSCDTRTDQLRELLALDRPEEATLPLDFSCRVHVDTRGLKGTAYGVVSQRKTAADLTSLSTIRSSLEPTRI